MTGSINVSILISLYLPNILYNYIKNSLLLASLSVVKGNLYPVVPDVASVPY